MSQKIKTSVEIDGSLKASQIANATTDTDKFLVSDAGTIKYRTGAEMLSDIGAQPLGSYVPTSRTITINGNTQDLSANLSFSIASGVTSFNTRTGAITLTSGDVTTALGYTPYNSSNPAGYISTYTETDTLATVTGRGATTSILSTFDGGLNIGNAKLRWGGATTPTLGLPFSGSTNAFWIDVNDGDTGGLMVDNEGVTVYGAGDNGYVFRVIDEDVYQSTLNVGSSTTFQITQGQNGGGFIKGNFDISGYTTIGGSAYLASGNSLFFDSGVTNDYSIRKNGTALQFDSAGDFTFNKGVNILTTRDNTLVLRAMDGGTNPWNYIEYVNSAGTRKYYVGTDTSNVFNIWSDDGTGYVASNTSFRSPIFYDSNNTGYYADFGATGNSLNIAGQIYTTKSTGTLISINGVDTIGYNSTTGGAYLKGTGNSYIYGAGLFFDGSVNQTLIHTGNIGSYAVPPSRTITINGTSYDLSANRSWTVTANAVETDTLATVVSRGDITNGGRPIRLDTSGGGVSIRGSAGGWATGYYFMGGPSNTYRGGFGALGDNDNLTNYWIGPAYNNFYTYIDASQMTHTSSMRAPVFYDSQDTAYYVNPGDASRIRKTDIVAIGSGWYDALNIYSSDATNKWSLLPDAGASNSLRFAYNAAERFRVQTNGSVISLVEHQSPIYYDFNNTAYYLNPDGTSRINTINLDTLRGPQGDWLLGYQSGTTYSFGSTAVSDALNIDFNSTNFANGSNWFGGYGSGSGPGLSFENQNTFARIVFWGLDFYDWNNGTQMVIDNGYVSANNSFRAPIFYDSNNTGYYVDPASTSNLNGLTVAGTISGNVSGTARKINIGSAQTITDLNISVGDAGSVMFDTFQSAALNKPVSGNNANGVLTFSMAHGPQYGKQIAFADDDDLYIRRLSANSYASWRKILHSGNYTSFNYFDMPYGGNEISGMGPITNWDSRPGVGMAGFGINWHTGVSISGYGGYGGVRLYASGYPTHSGSVLRLEASDSVKTYGTFTNDSSVRSPIFYDSNDTTYYVDPAGSATRAAFLNGNLWINPKSESYGEGIAFNMPAQGTWGGLRWYRNGPAGNYAGNWAFGYFGNESNNDVGFHNGTNGWRLDHSFNMTATGSVRSPIFYDNNDTGYYLDPNSISRLSAIDTGAADTYNQFRSWTNLTGHHGFYSSVHNSAHFYPNNGTYGAWKIDGNRNGWGGIEFGSGNGNPSLMISADSNTVGFHNNSYGWQIRWAGGTLYSGRNAYGGNDSIVLQEDKWINSKHYGSDGAFYSTVFYDSNNSAYYVNPDSTSRMYYINADYLYSYNYVYAQGDVIAYYSDERLKDRKGNIKNALDKVLSLNGFYYTNNETAKENGYDEDNLQIGLSAQEVQSIAPEIVTLAPFDTKFNEDGSKTSKSGKDYLTVNYNKVVPILVEAIKEQQTQIEELKELVNKLINKK